MSLSSIRIVHPDPAPAPRTLKDVLHQRGFHFVSYWMLREAMRRHADGMNLMVEATDHFTAIEAEEDRRICAAALDRVDLHVKP